MTNIPVPSLKTKESEAPRTSKILSGLTPKRLGSGGLKLGGGENEEEEEEESPRFSFSLVPTEVEVEVEELSDGLEVARIEMEALGVLVLGSCLKNGVDDKFRAPAIFPSGFRSAACLWQLKRLCT